MPEKMVKTAFIGLVFILMKINRYWFFYFSHEGRYDKEEGF